MIKKPIVCLVFGGKSSEYEVSLRSAYSVIKNMNREKYEVLKIGITRDGKWYLFQGNEEEILSGKWIQNKDNKNVIIDFSNGEFIMEDKGIKPDVVFSILHGEYGEDGRIQGVFECADLKYVGCDTRSSAVSMDKYITKRVVSSLGIDVAKDVVFLKNDVHNEEKTAQCVANLHFPMFIKPTRCGSSVGVCKANNEKELKDGLEKAFSYCDNVICEEFINGCEVEVAVMEKDGEILVSTVGNLEYKSDFYDYDTKYRSSDVSYKIPASIPEPYREKIRKYAKEIFLSLGCNSLARVDFFYTSEGRIVFNEINTMPGFTDISMFPMLFMKDGFDFATIIDSIISSAHN